MMFTVYSKPACPQCEQAKALLASKNLDYVVVHLDVGQAKDEFEQYISRDELLAKAPGAKTMPQIFKDDQRVGGLTELKKLVG